MSRVYLAWAVAAWGTAGWCAVEVVLRLATGATGGLAETCLLGAGAAGSGHLAFWRRRSLRRVAPGPRGASVPS